MKSFFQNTISISLAILVLFSTFSFSVGKHFCGDYLVNTALFTKADGCGMKMTSQKNQEKSCEVAKKSCCSDEEIVLEGQDELVTSKYETTTFKTTFNEVVVPTTFNYLLPATKENQYFYPTHPPPLIVCEIYKRDNHFLI